MNKVSYPEMPARVIRSEVESQLEQLGDFLAKQSNTSIELYVIRHGRDFLSRFPGKTKQPELSFSVMGARVVAKDVAEKALADYSKSYAEIYGKEIFDVEIQLVGDAIMSEFRGLHAFQNIFDYHYQRVMESLS